MIRRSRPSRPLLPLLVAVYLLDIAAVAHAAPTRPAPLRTEGDCVQVAAFVAVPVERAREHVPDGFTIVGEEAGTAFVLVTGGRCDAWTVDGRRGAALRFGLVSVLAHPVGGSPGLDGYDLWWLVGDRATHRGFRRLDVDARLVPDITMTTEPGALEDPVTAIVRVPWRVAPFTLEASLLPAGNPPGAFASGHWHEGRHGRVHGVHDNSDAVVVPALVRIDAAADTPLARLLGGTTFTLPGGWLRFHHSAVTRIVAGE